ncbi:unnamed protein product, partial [Mesorhabditis spiculigera]
MPPSRPHHRRHHTNGRGKRQEKPPFSYISLIAMAISNSPENQATLAEIYSYLQENYDFFRGDYVGWRNSIRHNLSLNDCFEKLPKEAGDRGRKGHKWRIAPTCEFMLEEGNFRRRSKGYKARKRYPFNEQSGQFEYPSTTTLIPPIADSITFQGQAANTGLDDSTSSNENEQPGFALNQPADVNQEENPAGYGYFQQPMWPVYDPMYYGGAAGGYPNVYQNWSDPTLIAMQPVMLPTGLDPQQCWTFSNPEFVVDPNNIQPVMYPLPEQMAEAPVQEGEPFLVGEEHADCHLPKSLPHAQEMCTDEQITNLNLYTDQFQGYHPNPVAYQIGDYPVAEVDC